ncbi:MAG: beta-lactamase family protein [Chloroflexi bacterium]|nr:beta-lactamase family protein [Chloroflexota bacterium]
MVTAQESVDSVGIDSICGEGALTITVSDTLPADDASQALDTILRQFVTVPTEELPPLSAVEPKPPAPGAVVFVDSPQGRYFRSIGAVDVESCVFVDPELRFPIGSNTKMFTAAVIFQLHEEGLLSTSDLVSQYLPEEIALFPGVETATIDMLLTHTSGLPDYLNSTDPATLGGRMGAGDWDVLALAYTPQELVAQAASHPLLFAPGTEAQWAYSNTGYIMLGQIIEQVTGKTYIEAVTERVIERLGMANTVLVAALPPAELGLATQYLVSPFTVNTSGWNFTQAWSAGNAVSTPEDMAIFLRAYYTGALYQNPETLEAMMTRAAPETPSNPRISITCTAATTRADSSVTVVRRSARKAMLAITRRRTRSLSHGRTARNLALGAAFITSVTRSASRRRGTRFTAISLRFANLPFKT